MALLAAVMLAALWGAPEGAPQRSADLDEFIAASRACPDEVDHCVGIALHVVVEDGAPVRDPRWFARQVAVANRHFDVLGIGFRVAEVDALPATDRHVATREHRDEIGAERFDRGVIHVFLIGRLDDVDVPDAEIRGVHWRLRRNTDKRWILLSGISSDMVLAHELGHFFTLPHSSHPISIMNKRPRSQPPRSKRTFHVDEVQKMRSALPGIVGKTGPLYRSDSR